MELDDEAALALDALSMDDDTMDADAEQWGTEPLEPLEEAEAGAAVKYSGRRESASSFLFRKDESGEVEGEGQADEETQQDVAAREHEREANQQKAKELADAEQQRRVDEDKDREDELAIVRQINIELSKTAQDEEQERRIHEYEIAKMQEQLFRERSKSEAIKAAEQERLRRIGEFEESEVNEEHERAKQQELAVQEMEKERIRRLSSQEHFEHMASRRKSSGSSSPTNTAVASPPVYFSATSGDDAGDFSEIPVVQSPASKILVDEHTEWRCFISSENPEQEKDNLRALRTSLEDDLKAEPHAKFQELVGDVRLLRFLRGHKMNVAVAATKFREMLELRKKHKLDEIRTVIVEKNMCPDEFPHFQKIIPHLPFLHAYDLMDTTQSHVFYFEMSGYADFRGLVEEVTDDEWLTFFLYEMEYRAMKLDQLSRTNEKLVQTIFVRDLTGFSISRFNPRLLKRLQSIIVIATKCYPETTRETIILRTPWIFHKIWNTITTTLLQETQLRKIHMSGDSYAHLVELIGGRDKLPKLLGGKDSSTHAIPQTGFLGRNSYVLLCEDGATQADIKAGGNLQLPFRMSANDTICWEYEVKAHDVEFGVKFRTQGMGGAEETEKIPMARVANGETVAGSFTATEEGTVVLSWDNSYSWTRGKSVAYKAKVVKSTHDFSCLDISGNDCV